MELGARHKLSAVIPTASITDISFLWVIYFLVTSAYPQMPAQLVLPDSRIRFEVPDGAATISINRDGGLGFNIGYSICGPLGRDAFIDRLAESLKEDSPNRPVVLKADMSVPYKHVDRVFDALRRAQINKVYFQTRQKIDTF